MVSRHWGEHYNLEQPKYVFLHLGVKGLYDPVGSTVPYSMQTGRFLIKLHAYSNPSNPSDDSKL